MGNKFQVVAMLDDDTAQYPYIMEIPNLWFMSNQFSAIAVEPGCYIDLYENPEYAPPTIRLDALTSNEPVYSVLTTFNDLTTSFQCKCGKKLKCSLQMKRPVIPPVTKN